MSNKKYIVEYWVKCEREYIDLRDAKEAKAMREQNNNYREVKLFEINKNKKRSKICLRK